MKLIVDDDGNIMKSVFVDNVRDFQGENPVNGDISNTISKGLLDQFVLRNNGVTIVSRDISITGQIFTVKDYQIVNGCQTSHVLHANRAALSDHLFVPVKLIYTEDEEIAQEIIKSTNRQTPIDENDLLALTKFSKEISKHTIRPCRKLRACITSGAQSNMPTEWMLRDHALSRLAYNSKLLHQCF